MERFTDAPYQRDWYVFDEKYRFVLWEDCLEINGLHPAFREGKVKPPTEAPYLILSWIGAHTLRKIVVSHTTPLKIELSGQRIGSYSHNTGYDAAANGRLSRRIVEASVSIELNSSFLCLSVSCLAAAVEPEPSEPPLSDIYREAIRFQYEFEIPIAEVPGFLNMDEDTRFKFSKTCATLD